MGMSRFIKWYSSKGFTLIELLIVIVIIALLMAIAIPAYLTQQTKAKDAQAKQHLAYAYRSVRAALPNYSNQFPLVASIVNDVSADQPELSIASGGCNSSANEKQVAVDPILTNSNRLALYSKSQTGTWWRLNATPTGTPALKPLGTCNGPLGSAVVTRSGNELTDSMRAGGSQGDGLAPESSIGIWQSETNNIKNSSAETTATANVASIGSGSIVISRDSGARRFGSASFKIVSDGSATNQGISWIDTAATDSRIAVVSSRAYAISAYVLGSGSVQVGVNWYDASGVFISSAISTTYTLSGSWQRATLLATSPVNAAESVPYVINPAATAQTFWVDAAQQEGNTNFATPYIFTDGAAVARGAGFITAPSTLIDPNQMWIAIRFRPAYNTSPAGTDYMLFSWASSGTNSFDIIRHLANGWDARINTGTQYVAVKTVSFNQGDALTVIGELTPTQIGLSVNGSSFALTTRGSSLTAPPATFSLGRRQDTGSGWLSGNILWYAGGTGTLSDSDAATINSWGDSDPTSQDFPASAAATFAWDGETNTYVTGN
jgi:prepilin-type N-terminal cleavage/methylation domain-containing protein